MMTVSSEGCSSARKRRLDGQNSAVSKPLPPEVEEPRVYRVILLELWEFYVTISDLQALGFQAIAVQGPPIMPRVVRIEPVDELTLADVLESVDPVPQSSDDLETESPAADSSAPGE